MSKITFIKIKTRNFPKDIIELDHLFQQNTNSENIYYISNKGSKICLSDINIASIKNQVLHQSEEIDIYSESLKLNVNFYVIFFFLNQNEQYNKYLTESLIPGKIHTNSFEYSFDLITKECLDLSINAISTRKKFDIKEILSKYTNEDKINKFKNFAEIILLINTQRESFEKEQETTSIILSNYENLTLNYQKENELLKKQVENLKNEQLHSSNITFVTKDSCQSQDKSLEIKINEITNYCKKIQKDFNERKDFIESDLMSKFLEKDFFCKTSKSDKFEILNDISEFMKNLCIVPVILFDSIQMNNLFRYNRKETIFCNLCNEFKRKTNLELKLCETHIACESCFKNYSKKIKCLREKLCYCQTNN